MVGSSHQSVNLPSRGGSTSTIFSTFILLLQSALILFCVVLLLIALSPLLLYRWILSKICTILRPDLTHILALQGANFLHRVSGSQYEEGNVVLRFKLRGGQLNFEALSAKFHEKCVLAEHPQRNGALCYPEFQQYLVKWAGYFFWKQEDNFRIEDHVVLKRWATLKNVPMSEAQINKFEVEFLNDPLPSNKSPWEIIVLENTEGEDPWFLVLFKFHHSLTDGARIFEALLKCTDEPVPSKAPETRKLATICRISWLCQALTFPFRAAYDLSKTMKFKSVRTIWDNLMPATPTTGQSSTKRFRKFISRANAIEVSRIKRIATRNSVSFTGVLIAGVAGGVRKLLRNKLSSDEIPEYLVMQMPVPIPSSRPDGLANSFCTVTFCLPVGSSSMEQRLALAEQSFQDRKKSTEAHVTNFQLHLSGLISHVFPPLPLDFAPIGLSSFPGPTKSLKIDGQEMYDMSYVVLDYSFALLTTVFSYANCIQFYCVGIDTVFSSQAEIIQLVSFIEQEFCAFEELEQMMVVDLVEDIGGSFIC